MEAIEKTGSLAVVCSPDGIIRKVLSTLPGVTPKIGRKFISIIDPESIQKALAMFHSIKPGTSSSYWELNVTTSGIPRTLHFIGITMETNILFVGSTSDGRAEQLLNELILLNNEQTNTVRRAVREKVRSDNAYDELTTMNNEMANLQRSLQKANHELEKLNILKNQIIGMAAHDIRGPIGAITGLSEMALEMLPDGDPNVREILSEIKKASVKIHIMVNDLLDVVKIETGKFELHLGNVDIIELINRGMKNIMPAASAKSISIEFMHDETSRSLTADADKLEQVIDNLLSNAVKYAPRQSAIIIRTAMTGGSIEVSIADEGQGIAPDKLDKLFQPFGRAGSIPTGGESSTGLGLVICRRIIEEHGGRIWVESTPGEGSTFTFTLPLQTVR